MRYVRVNPRRVRKRPTTGKIKIIVTRSAYVNTNMPDTTTPIIAPLESVNEVSVGSVASRADGRVVYVGALASHDRQRKNLAVVHFDDTGTMTGVQLYADSDEPLPDDANVTNTSIVVNAAGTKLYLASMYTSSYPMNIRHVITVYDLDTNGDPVGSPRGYTFGTLVTKNIALALHPSLNLLYVVGQGSTTINVYNLDSTGEPTGNPHAYTIGSHAKSDVTISPDGTLMYLGSYPDVIEVVNLDSSGMPLGSARTFTAGTQQTYATFSYSPSAVFIPRTTTSGSRVGVWQLDATGSLVGTPRVLNNVPVSKMRVDLTGSRLWVAGDSFTTDVFTSSSLLDGAAVSLFDLSVDPLVTGTAQQFLPAQTARVATGLTLGPDSRPVMVTEPATKSVSINRVRGYNMRATVMSATYAGTPPSLYSLSLVTDKTVSMGQVPLGSASAWFNLDSTLRDKGGAIMSQVTVSPAPLSMSLTLEITPAETGDNTTRTFATNVSSSNTIFFLPGYTTPLVSDRLASIKLMRDQANAYLSYAQVAPISASDRPVNFVVSAYQMMGVQGDETQMRTEAQTLNLLGFNTVNAYAWGNIDPAVIDAELDAVGIQRRIISVYSPPSLFASALLSMASGSLDSWASGTVVHGMAPNGATPDDIVTFHLADEPGWYFPGAVSDIIADTNRLAAFHDYLHSTGLTLSDFGATDWDAIMPLSASQVVDAPTRKTYYWTTKFLSDDAVSGLRMAREAIERALGLPVNAAVNWNDRVNVTYTPSPNVKIGNNPIVNASTAMGSVDWFESSRNNSSVPWSEDWFDDVDAQCWSFYGDALRSVAALGPGTFGAYVVGNTIGTLPKGARYKILSLVGHGAKTLDIYTFGPHPFFGDSWSDRSVVYPEITDALSLIGRVENVLYPGQVSRGQVAILVPGASLLWEGDSAIRYYSHEIKSLHYALMHAGYTVDFVDESDVASGYLATREYTALYLTEPDVPTRTLSAIDVWVRAGGTLVVTPGGGVANEYDESSTVLDSVLGLAPRSAERSKVPSTITYTTASSLTSIDPSLGFASFGLRGPLQALTPAGAQVMATFASGSAAITSNSVGDGVAYAFGFYPGWNYWVTPNRRKTALPYGWGDSQRSAATLGARISSASKPVTVDHDVVEARRLDSDAGIAIVLLNWTGVPIDQLTVTVPNCGIFQTARSAELGALTSQFTSGSLVITLPLTTADILTLTS